MIREIKRPQVIGEDVLQALEEIIADARAGRVVDIVVVANDADGKEYHRCSDFQNAWHLLGALEYAKESVLRGIDR